MCLRPRRFAWGSTAHPRCGACREQTCTAHQDRSKAAEEEDAARLGAATGSTPRLEMPSGLRACAAPVMKQRSPSSTSPRLIAAGGSSKHGCRSYTRAAPQAPPR